MTNKKLQDKQGLKRAATLIDKLVMTAFALGILTVISLFIYVLSAGAITNH